MPARVITIDGRQWQVYPSGLLTQYTADEFGVIFVSGAGADRVVRVSRYSPAASAGTTARESSLATMSADDLTALFRTSQPGVRSPEVGYRS